MTKSKETIVRVYLVYVGMLLFAGLVLGQIVNVQIFHGTELREQAKELTVDLREVKAPRGNIYADNEAKTSLALSVPRYKVYMDPMTVDAKIFESEAPLLADSLAELFPTRDHKEWLKFLQDARNRKSRYLRISKNCRNEDIEKLVSFPIFKLGKYKGGLILIKENLRVKPYGLLAWRTIGYVRDLEADPSANREAVTIKVGLEGAYDEYLRGQDGKMLMRKIRGSSDWKPIESDLSTEPIAGKDVYTSIDIELQDVAESALLDQLEKQDALRGCVVVMEVQTGYIKAIANLTKDTAQKRYRETSNISVGVASEPGSTFKLASLIRLLEDGYLNITDSIEMKGKYTFYSSSLHDPVEYGKNTVQYAFEVSSNVFAELVNNAYSSQPQKFIDGLKGMSLGSKLGISIPGERRPLIKNASDSTFSGITLPWMAIGYEVEQLPLHTLALYNAVANNGVMMKPQIVKSIKNGEKIIEKFEPEVLNPKICSEATLKDVKQCLIGVVERGTAKNVKARGFEIAGKTGTAKIAEKGSYGNKYQASFCGYFPADKPKYSCVVVIQGPTQQIYGAIVSGTVFKEIADKVYAASLEQPVEDEVEIEAKYPYSKHGSRSELLNVMGHMGVKVNDASEGTDWVLTSTGENIVEFKNRKVADGEMPNVKGMGLEDALYLLEKQGLSVRVRGEGIVKYQSVEPGFKIQKGQLVTIELVL